MKLNAFALMLIFMSFVTLPSILSNVCKDVDMSSVFNFAEEKEEKHKSGAEQNGEFASSFGLISFNPYLLCINDTCSAKFFYNFFNLYDKK